MKRIALVLSAVMLLMTAVPASASPPEDRRGGPENRGRTEVKFTDVLFDDELQARVARYRNEDLRLVVAPAAATGTTVCERCRDHDEKEANIIFDSMDLRIVGLPDVPNIEGRAEGIILWDLSGDGRFTRVRWQGTVTGNFEFSDPGNNRAELQDLLINGIAIDHVGAGLTDRGRRAELSFTIPFAEVAAVGR